MNLRLRKNKTVNIILFILGFILIILLFFRSEILKQIVNILTRLDSSAIKKLKLANLVFMLIYMIFFGVLGYRAALKRKLNVKKWTFYCAILGIWAYLYMLFSNPKR